MRAKLFFLLVHAIPKNIKNSLTATPDNFDNRLLANITNRIKKQKQQRMQTYIKEIVTNRRTTYTQPLLEWSSLFQALEFLSSRARCLFCPFLCCLAQRMFPQLSSRISCIHQSHNLQKYVNCENEKLTSFIFTIMFSKIEWNVTVM